MYRLKYTYNLRVKMIKEMFQVLRSIKCIYCNYAN